MTNPTEPKESLRKLRERVAGLTGPSREVDAEIDAALFGGRASHTFDEDTSAARLRRGYDRGTVFDHTDPQTNGGHVLSRMTRKAGSYTASINAALALVERLLSGWAFGFDQGPKTRIAFADPHDFADRFFGARHTAEAPTAPLAILLALLHALIAQEES